MLWTSSKNKNDPKHFSGQLNRKPTYYCAEIGKKTSCELCYYADINFDMLPVTMPDRLTMPDN